MTYEHAQCPECGCEEFLWHLRHIQTGTLSIRQYDDSDTVSVRPDPSGRGEITGSNIREEGATCLECLTTALPEELDIVMDNDT